MSSARAARRRRSSRPRLGTRIAVPTARVASFEVPRIDEEIRRGGAEYGYQLLQRRSRAADTATREHLHLPRGARVLEVRCLHRANHTPYQYEHRWINLSAVPAAREARFRDIAPGLWLLEHVPWTDVEHVLSAANADAETATLLELSPGDAVFVVERRTWLDDKVVTWAVLSHPGQHSRMRAPGKPQAAAQAIDRLSV